jgi:fluoroquinolone resistance protein
VELPYFREKKFEGSDHSASEFPRGEYEQCVFINCRLAGADLSGSEFLDCIFRDCDLSMAKTVKTAWQEVKFEGCKMMGLRIDQSNSFGLSFSFSNCLLQYASFYRMKLKKINFTNCQLTEADFTEADLTGASFPGCDLAGAKFEQTVLEKADLREAVNYSIDPTLNRIRNARFSYPGVIGLLDTFHIKIDRD